MTSTQSRPVDWRDLKQRQETATGFTHLGEERDYRPTGRQFSGMVLVVVVLTIIGGQLGFGTSFLFDERWLARAEVQYRGTAWTETQDVAIQSRSLIGPVAEDLDIPIKLFEQRLDAGLVPGTQILRLDYISVDPVLAEEVVTRLADDYLQQASERTPQSIRGTLSEELEEIAAELERAENRLQFVARDDSPQGQVDQAAAQAAMNSLRARRDDLEIRLLENKLQLIDEESNGLPVMVTEPFVFEEKVFPRPLIFTAVGIGAGGLLGLAIALFIWNRNSWRVATESHAERDGGEQANAGTPAAGSSRRV